MEYLGLRWPGVTPHDLAETMSGEPRRVLTEAEKGSAFGLFGAIDNQFQIATLALVLYLDVRRPGWVNRLQAIHEKAREADRAFIEAADKRVQQRGALFPAGRRRPTDRPPRKRRSRGCNRLLGVGGDLLGGESALHVAELDPRRDGVSVRGIDVIWTMDALKEGTYSNGGSAIPDQWFPKATPGETPQWPGQFTNGAFVLSWLLFVTGTFQFLDGGRLDLGVVRDSVLDATNDYETFLELFEGIAFRGNECYQIQSTIKPNGGSAGTIAVDGYAE